VIGEKAIQELTDGLDSHGYPGTGTVWDGEPKFHFSNLCNMSVADICRYVFPGGSAESMLGLKQEYDRDPPFKDEKKPTVGEIEEWNIRVINHFRSLFGIPTKLENDRCMFLQVQWSEERFLTRYWDSKYPFPDPNPLSYPDGKTFYGPCTGDGKTPQNGGLHCGKDFSLNCEDQKLYHDGECCPRISPIEGSVNAPRDLPWSVKMAQVIKGVVCDAGEGYKGGHATPFYGAKKLGASFRVNDRNVSVRLQWMGYDKDVPLPSTGVGCNPP
jgi:hypothetical protein